MISIRMAVVRIRYLRHVYLRYICIQYFSFTVTCSFHLLLPQWSVAKCFVPFFFFRFPESDFAAAKKQSVEMRAKTHKTVRAWKDK